MAIIRKLFGEILHVLPALIYFLIFFNLITFTQRLLLREYSATFGSYLAASLGALLAAKMLIVINSFAFINAYPKKPMIYNITWKFLIYSIGTIVFRILEIVFKFCFGLIHYDNLTSLLYERLTSPLFWAVEIWVLILFLGYIIASEFARVLGGKELRKLILGY